MVRLNHVEDRETVVGVETARSGLLPLALALSGVSIVASAATWWASQAKFTDEMEQRVRASIANVGQRLETAEASNLNTRQHVSSTLEQITAAMESMRKAANRMTTENRRAEEREKSDPEVNGEPTTREDVIRQVRARMSGQAPS
jgi:DNA-binding PucR family transcriptional regulator